MKMHANTVRQIMRHATTRPVSERALFLFAMRLEKFIQNKATEAEALLLQRNQLRREKGLREKVRITEELLMEVLGAGQ